MNAHDFLMAVNEIDDRYLLEASEFPPTAHASARIGQILRITFVAAILLSLLAVAAAHIQGSSFFARWFAGQAELPHSGAITILEAQNHIVAENEAFTIEVTDMLLSGNDKKIAFLVTLHQMKSVACAETLHPLKGYTIGEIDFGEAVDLNPLSERSIQHCFPFSHPDLGLSENQFLLILSFMSKNDVISIQLHDIGYICPDSGTHSAIYPGTWTYEANAQDFSAKETTYCINQTLDWNSAAVTLERITLSAFRFEVHMRADEVDLQKESDLLHGLRVALVAQECEVAASPGADFDFEQNRVQYEGFFREPMLSYDNLQLDINGIRINLTEN